MSILVAPSPPVVSPGIVYPDSDGKPMSDNTKQLRWIVLLFNNLSAQFSSRDDVFVGADLSWYPVKGESEIRTAPDVLVAFGRPKGDRGSWKQWEEGDVPLTVVFEILSPGNSLIEMINKYSFYEEYGVEEYYIFDPDSNQLSVFRRQGTVFKRVWDLKDFVSPRLGISFDLNGPELIVRDADGQPFVSLEQERNARKQANQRAERMALLSRKARRGEATPEELLELERLEDQTLGPT